MPAVTWAVRYLNPNGLFSIASLMLHCDKIRIKLQNTIAVDRN